jgi:hypothetical protein
MYDQREPSFTSSWASSAGSPHSTRWVAWMPLLFVAAFLYWSVALGLGGLSLMAASAISGDLDQGPELAPSVMEPAPGHVFGDPIVVHLEESAEPEDVNDNAGAVTPSDGPDRVDQVESQTDNDDGTGRLPGQSRN